MSAIVIGLTVLLALLVAVLCCDQPTERDIAKFRERGWDARLLLADHWSVRFQGVHVAYASSEAKAWRYVARLEG